MTTRFAFLDGVRAFAAVFVVLHHSWLTVYPSYPYYDGPAALGWLAYGQLAVAVFIVLSGFSLSLAPARHDWQLTGGVLTYLRRRAWRILPTYWAALAFSCLVFGLITRAETGSAVTARGVLVHAVLLQDVIDSAKPNGAFWSIAVEWQIYFLFPVLLLALRRLGTAAMLGGTAVLVIGSYLLATRMDQFAPLLNLTPQFLLLFALGVAGARVAGSDRAEVGRAAVGVAGAATAVLLALLLLNDLPWVEEHYFWVDVVAGVAAAAALGSMATGRLAPLSRMFAARGPAAIGAYSYSIYCVHLPILWLVWHFAIAPLEPSALVGLSLLTLVGLPVVLIGSYVFSRIFERPFVRHRSFGQLYDRYFGRERLRSDDDSSAERPVTTLTPPQTESNSIKVTY